VIDASGTCGAALVVFVRAVGCSSSDS